MLFEFLNYTESENILISIEENHNILNYICIIEYAMKLKPCHQNLAIIVSSGLLPGKILHLTRLLPEKLMRSTGLLPANQLHSTGLLQENLLHSTGLLPANQLHSTGFLPAKFMHSKCVYSWCTHTLQLYVTNINKQKCYSKICDEQLHDY